MRNLYRKSFTLIEMMVVGVIVMVLGVIIFGVATGDFEMPSNNVGYGNHEVTIEGHRMIKNWETQMLTHHPSCTFGKCGR